MMNDRWIGLAVVILVWMLVVLFALWAGTRSRRIFPIRPEDDDEQIAFLSNAAYYRRQQAHRAEIFSWVDPFIMWIKGSRGRPPKNGVAPKGQVGVRLSIKDREFLRRLGEGNITSGVELLVKEARKKGVDITRSKE